MDFKENFCFAYVSDNLQHFSKFDLFDLCDLWRPIKGQNNAFLSVNFIFLWSGIDFLT